MLGFYSTIDFILINQFLIIVFCKNYHSYIICNFCNSYIYIRYVSPFFVYLVFIKVEIIADKDISQFP